MRETSGTRERARLPGSAAVLVLAQRAARGLRRLQQRERGLQLGRLVREELDNSLSGRSERLARARSGRQPARSGTRSQRAL